MFRNYLKIAWRSLLKNRMHSLINIGGLAVGMAVVMVIALWIYDELSFNTYHKNYSQIAKVMGRDKQRSGDTYTNDTYPIPLGKTIRSNYGVDFKYIVQARETESHIVSSGNKKFTQMGNYMQPDAPDMLSLNMIHGTRGGLKDIHSILLSQSLSQKLFGNADPVNQLAKIDNRVEVKITGVYEDIPNNSDFKDAQFIAPFDLYTSTYGINTDDWRNYNILTYVQLNENADYKSVSNKIKDILVRNGDKEVGTSALFLQPMSEWHLYSEFENGVAVTSKPLQFVWFYAIIGFFVLLLACINFMNLSTARSEKRAKEVGIRKTIGSVRGQLVSQFFIESTLVSFLAFLIAINLVQLILPWFNGVAGKSISIPWSNMIFWVSGICFSILTGLMAGSYPALYLSSFKPIKVLKGTFRVSRYAFVPRKVLVVLQFSVSIALIIGTIIVYRQIQFVKDRPVGYSNKGLITMEITTPDYSGKYDVLRNELKKTGVVTEMAESGRSITNTLGWNNGFDWRGKKAGFDPSFNTIWVSPEYGKTIGWEFIQGRDFSREIKTDSAGLVINESAAILMGLENPVGEIVSWKTEWNPGGTFKILGVTKDVLNGSPYKSAYPAVFFMGEGNWIFMRLNPNSSPSHALAKIQPVFSKILPSTPFDYKFADEEYGKKFEAEERTGRLAFFFAVLAIFISCLGLFGLASFVAEQRTKEISVRKVLGASIFNVWRLLTKEFVLLVTVSLCIAAPVAFYFMKGWLQNYQYRTNISWWIFAAAGLGALTITLLTVSFQAIKAAISSPIKSLRTG